MTISYDKQVLIKRGNTASVSTYVGPLGELVLDTDTNQVYVHDGVTVGGNIVGDEAAIATLTANAAAQSAQISQLQTDITTANTNMKGYVDNSISSNIAAIIGGAPGALDTLNELANALGNNANFSTTITNSLASLTSNVAIQAEQIAAIGANIGTGNITFPDNTIQTTAWTGDITGNITVGNSAVNFVSDSSGDGNGYTTIQIIPDSSLTANDQYLIIDPTAPQHIHIRAGGTQDASGAELYLGGELNYVRVVDDTGVRLQNRTRNNTFYNFVDPTDFNTATWYESAGTYFVQYTAVDAEIGNLAFTIGNDNENTVTVYYGGGSSQTLTYDSSSSNLGGGVYRFSVVEAPPASPTVLTAIDFEIWTNRTNSVVLSSNDFEVSVTDDLRLTGSDTVSLRNRSADQPVSIVTNYDSSEYEWDFRADGSLTAPGDIIVSGDITGTSGASTLYLKAQPDSNTYIQLNNSVDSVISTVANLEIRTSVSSTAKTWEFDTTGNLTFPDDTVQTTAYTGPQTTLVGATVPAVGGTASANETGITYSNKIAIFTEGAFTVGVWTDVQVGWTVTDNNGFTDTIASRGGFGAASFVTTVNNWPAPASGKTYVFTSPDYQPASVSPVEITVGNNDWLFNNNGSVTFPDATVQTTAYAGGVGRALMIDTNRTDSYTENGSADRPFKTFAAAIAAATASDATAFTFTLMGCTVTETVDFSTSGLTAITISTTSRSIIEGNVLIANIPTLSQLVIRNIEIGGTFTLTGDGTADQMNNCSFYHASFSGAVSITAANAAAFYEVAFFNTVAFTNLSYLYINGAQFNTDWTIRADNTGTYPIPSRGISPGTGGSVGIVFGIIANNVNFVKGGTAAFVFQPHMSRMGIGAGTYTVPVGWTMTPHSTVLRGTWVNNGTVAMRNSSSDNAIGGTTPTYTGTIGGAAVRFNDATVQTTAWIGTVDYANVANAPTAYSNINVASLLSAFGSNSITTTGNIAGNTINITGSVNTGGTLNFTSAEATDTAKIFTDVSSTTTSMVLEVGDDNSDKIVLRHYSFDAGTTLDMITAQRASNTESNVTIIGNLTTTNQITAIGSITGSNLISSATIYGNVDVILGNIANVSAAKTRIVSDNAFSYIQTGNGTVGSTGKIVFSPYFTPTQQVVIDTASGNISATGNITAQNFIGNIRITGNVTGTSANVDLVAGANTWSFDNTGNLTFPDSTVQSTAYVAADNVVKVTGSWTVTSGTANYSFTVPDNGVYQLWVRGNIPNGIITYTATVSVTNTNVPVIGQQFAWNYEGAGNPIMLTSIPDQIIGTAGTISNANPSVGATTNTFVFGISNTSGGNVTVNYGYTTIS